MYKCHTREVLTGMEGRCSLEAHRNGRGGCGVQRAEVRSSRTLTVAEGCGSGRVRDVAREAREANQARGGGQCLEDGVGLLKGKAEQGCI